MTPEEINEIEVGQFEFKKAYSPDVLSSGGLGPCIAVGVFDPLTRSGYIMHSPGFKICEPEMEFNLFRIIEDYLGSSRDLSKLKVFAAGCAFERDDDLDFRKFKIDERAHAERILRNYFNDSQLTIKWTPNNHIAALSLYTSTGKFEVDYIDLDDFWEE